MVAVDAVIIEVLSCNNASTKARNLPICQRRHGQSTSWQLTSRPPKHSD